MTLRWPFAGVFHRHQRSRGVVLWRWGSVQVELWYLPAEERILPHTHPRIDSTLYLFSWDADIGVRRPGEHWDYGAGGWLGKRFRIGPRDQHWISTWSPTLVLNVQRWVGSPTSAAVDWVDV